MIVTQEKAFLKSQAQLNAMIEWVREAESKDLRVDDVERTLFYHLLEIGLSLLQAHVAAAGDGDQGKSLEHEGCTLQRLKKPHARRYLSVFGELKIQRRVYAVREGQAIERAPLDEQLGLPQSDFSYVLEDWLQRFCVKESMSEAAESLHTLLRLKPSVASIERMNQRMASFAEAYVWQHAPPPANEEGSILVATADGKGVPMRRPLEERIRGPKRRGKGEKANKKQMAYVGAVYSIQPFIRTAEDVINEVRRRQRAQDRPVPQHKRVWAEMTRVMEGETYNGKSLLFIQLAKETEDRNPDHQKPFVCLMDGEAGLWESQREWLPGAVQILDLFHALERLWGVAYCFHPERSREAEQFVEHYLRLLLEGKVGYAIGNLRRLLTRHDLKGQHRRTLLSTIGYYNNNRAFMRYDEYLAAGYPIGSGVAEGACRHLVKDRMEQTGMRWTVNGAQSMLHLRALYLNGDWESFVDYRIHNEQTKLYGSIAA